jgi:hypothetical protein
MLKAHAEPVCTSLKSCTVGTEIDVDQIDLLMFLEMGHQPKPPPVIAAIHGCHPQFFLHICFWAD